MPAAWRDHITAVAHRETARLMGDGEVAFTSWGRGYDPEDEVDRAVVATRKAVFPLLGLDAQFD